MVHKRAVRLLCGVDRRLSGCPCGCALSLKKGDEVRIVGYLISASRSSDLNSIYLDSSVSRADDGDRACEIIYVTDLEFL